MIRVHIDPGSGHVAVLVTSDDAAPPYLVRYVDRTVISVGEVTYHDPPIPQQGRDKTLPDGTVVPGKTWLKHETRTVTEEHEREASIKVIEFLTPWLSQIGEVTFERGGSAYGETIAALRSQSAQLIKTARVATWIAARLEAGGVSFGYVWRQTWAARLSPVCREHAPAGADTTGAMVTGRGEALDPVLAALVQGWEQTADPHLRDVGGMALWGALPALPGAHRKSTGSRRLRSAGGVKRTPKGGKGSRYPRGARAWGKKSPEERERVHVVERARYARTIGAARYAAREASGCNCKPPGVPKKGRHKASCPVHIAKYCA